MKVVVDAFGGDNAPKEIVKGCVLALELDNNLKIVLCGKEKAINEYLEKYDCDSSRIEIVDAPEVISNNESPTEAIRTKKNSSLVKSFDVLKNDEDCVGLVSAGSTGAVLTGGFLKIGRLKGVSRPALAPLIPTKKNGFAMLIDCGANMDCKPINLCHFAAMGSAYFKALFGVKRPRVALLNVGTEDHKGNDLCKQTFPLLKEMDINFVGNMEARDICSGDYDVVVADGFAGNVLLKSLEGTVGVMMSEIKENVKKGFFSKIGAAFMINTFKKMKSKFDFNQYGGSPFVGCKKIVIKAHGASKAKSIQASIEQILELNQKNINEKIEKAISSVNISEE